MLIEPTRAKLEGRPLSCFCIIFFPFSLLKVTQSEWLSGCQTSGRLGSRTILISHLQVCHLVMKQECLLEVIRFEKFVHQAVLHLRRAHGVSWVYAGTAVPAVQGAQHASPMGGFQGGLNKPG